MQYANIVFTTALLLLSLFACSASQSTSFSENNSIEKTRNNKSTGTHPETSLSIPVDGKLGDEHLKLYVSVTILVEQLRYEQVSAQLQKSNRPFSQNSTNNRALEELAIDYFGYDPQLYYWSKKIIEKILNNPGTPAQNTDDVKVYLAREILFHNIAILEKNRDELQFALNYRLKSGPAKAQHSEIKTTGSISTASTQHPST